jgi:hypothetical protein
MKDNKKLKFSKKVKLEIISLAFLIGTFTGFTGARLFPEPIYTETFHVFGTNHVDQKVYRTIGPNNILMYNLGPYRSIPLNEYLKETQEDYYEKENLKKIILESARKTRIIKIR